MSRNLRDVIYPNVEMALDKHGDERDDLTWDLAYVMMPTPGGPALSSFFLLSMRSPDLTLSGLTAPVMLDPLDLKDPEKAERAVIAGLDSLRSLRAQILASSNGDQPPNNGGLII